MLMGQIGALLELPQVVLDLSPFTHVPPVPVAEATALPLVSLSLVALGLAGAGLLWFRHRDLTT
jgi:ABC-2 type transport system permease protein